LVVGLIALFSSAAAAIPPVSGLHAVRAQSTSDPPLSTPAPDLADDASWVSLELAPADRRPIAQRGETYLRKEFAFSYTGGAVMLSGDPAPTTPFGVDDRLLIEVRRPDGSTVSWERMFTAGCYENEPIPAEDIRSLFQPGRNAITVTITDVCAARVGTLGRVLLSTLARPAGTPPLLGLIGSLVPWVLLLITTLTGMGLILAGRQGHLALRPPVTREQAEPMLPAQLGTGPVLPEPPPWVGPQLPQAAVLAVSHGLSGERLTAGAPHTIEEWRVEIGRIPCTIGTGRDCAIRLPGTAEDPPVKARVWLTEDGRIMLHRLTQTRALMEGNEPSWTSLSAGDDVRLGPYRLRCIELREAPEPPPSASPTVTDRE
jgi:hypothetical protein